ncbi:MAG: sodium:solute symporter family protein [Balneolales bacterium]|nr:sodium:solute symporter family protein [Balneolales bacterium]
MDNSLISMNPVLNWMDFSLIGGYFLLLIVLSWRAGRFLKDADGEERYLLSGRRLSLPAFVATLVSTWYGGILGVGEFSYLFGISQWIVMGLPYYLFAMLFAFFFAGKIRENKAISIPEAVGNAYGPLASRISAALIFLLVNPAPYILMVAMIAKFMLGIDGFYVTVGVAVFSAVYVAWGGFGAVVRTDMLQVVLMYAGFGILLMFAWSAYGSPATLPPQLPASHLQPTGGQPISYLLVWFFIALWTFVDPGFHQRAAAAKSPKTARNGIFVAIGAWFIFDMATLITALYAVAVLTDLPDAVLVYPALASHLLPAGLLGLFILTLLATVMSTLDSFLFLAGQTLGRDFNYKSKKEASLAVSTQKPGNIIQKTQAGIGVAAVLGLLLVWLFPSVIELWYVIGSVVIPGLLLPVVGIYYPWFRVRAQASPWLFLVPVLVAFLWLVGGLLSQETYGYAWLGVEPFYPGIAASIGLFTLAKANILFFEKMR